MKKPCFMIRITKLLFVSLSMKHLQYFGGSYILKHTKFQPFTLQKSWIQITFLIDELD